MCAKKFIQDMGWKLVLSEDLHIIHFVAIGFSNFLKGEWLKSSAQMLTFSHRFGSTFWVVIFYLRNTKIFNLIWFRVSDTDYFHNIYLYKWLCIHHISVKSSRPICFQNLMKTTLQVVIFYWYLNVLSR